MSRANIPRPKTLIVHKDNKNFVADYLGLPCVLKQPDSSFSQGVIKVNTRQELKEKLAVFLENSDLIIAQEFLPTEFDWRIGILDKKPLYACKYFMARGHWQIVNWINRKEGISKIEGEAEVMPVDEVPEKVLKTALRSANLVGDGFYGVDLKEKNGKIYVIEVNDNPNICVGDEDLVLKDKLYLEIMQSILNRIKMKKK
jgi:glutathione synthase/RimK-type ligase-like ATP-grasp enzyme